MRANSYSTEKIDFDSHSKWFTKKLNDPNCYLYVFEQNENLLVGQVRIEKQPDHKRAVIGISIDKNFRNRGLSLKLLDEAVTNFLLENNDFSIDAYIKRSNAKSVNAFLSAGFKFIENLQYKDTESSLYRI